MARAIAFRANSDFAFSVPASSDRDIFLDSGIAHISPRVAAGMSRIQVHPWRMSDTGAAPCDCPFELSVGRRSLRNTQQLSTASRITRSRRKRGGPKTCRQLNGQWRRPDPIPRCTPSSVRLTDGGTRAPDRLPRVVLSQDTWLRQFGGKPHIAGAKLHVGSVNAIVAGVAFGGSTVLPGGAKAWLLDSDSQVGNGKSEFVVGHLSRGGYFDDGRWGLSVGGILLAFLVLPFVRRLSIGEYGSGSHKPSLARRGRFWTFLFAKITILLAIVLWHVPGPRLFAGATLLAIVGLHTELLLPLHSAFLGLGSGLSRQSAAAMPYLPETHGASG